MVLCSRAYIPVKSMVDAEYYAESVHVFMLGQIPLKRPKRLQFLHNTMLAIGPNLPQRCFWSLGEMLRPFSRGVRLILKYT